MRSTVFSDAYVQCLAPGPFPGRIDPWAEDDRYFHQIHGGIIGYLLRNLWQPLLKMGYRVGREASLHIIEKRQPDVYVEDLARASERTAGSWDYVRAAEEVQAEIGVALTMERPDVDAVYIRENDTGNLVTIVEVISPRNKSDSLMMLEYQERRERVVEVSGINVVEIDLTRSIRRLVQDTLATLYPYHVAVFMPQQTRRLVGIDLHESLKRIALPLRGEVIAVDLQPAYDEAFRDATIAASILNDENYKPDALPFPSTLTEPQRRQLQQSVEAWQAELERLRREET